MLGASSSKEGGAEKKSEETKKEKSKEKDRLIVTHIPELPARYESTVAWSLQLT